jgi:beta-phosphoglucomutase-like phosphatase (HAD superfamily)
VPAANAIAFEDSGTGLQAARAAGLWTVITPTYWTKNDDFTGAGLVLPSLFEPTQVLQQLSSSGTLKAFAMLAHPERGVSHARR